jgi:succinoglycan biosynthesis protein ExoU
VLSPAKAMKPLSDICVIVAARDAAGTIGRAVSSALRQREVREVVVIDDASTDATAEAAHAADDHSGRFRLIRLTENLGPSAARNRVLAMTEAEFVCVLDADDLIQDRRFERMSVAATDHWDLLADDLLRAAEGVVDRPDDLLVGLREGERRDIDLCGFVTASLPDPRRPRRELGYLKPVMRRSFLEKVGLRYDESLRLGEDFVFYAQALLRGARFILLPACGYVAVDRPGSLSRSHGVAELSALLGADGRLLDEARRRRPDAVRVLRAHRQTVRRDLAYRMMLAARHEGNWLDVTRHLLTSPAITAYLIGEIARARISFRG